jgi:probable F420-dependent oxidoreductase
MPETALRFGLISPVLSLVPGQCSPWEEAAGPAEIVEIAIAADRLGFDYLTCSDHVGIPTAAVKARGPRFYDQLATFGYLAALTKQIRLLTHIIVLPYHHPLEVAKRFGTLDRLSGGRVILGVGVGSLKEEFELLGVDFDGRGPRYEDALLALRAALGKRQPSYQGEHFRFSDFVIDPCALQERVPIWVGGRTPRSLRRALGFGDGWDPFGLSLEQLATLISEARTWPEWQQRAGVFDIALNLEPPPDLSNAEDRARAIDQIAALKKAGATAINVLLKTRSKADYLEQLEALKREVAPRFA